VAEPQDLYAEKIREIYERAELRIFAEVGQRVRDGIKDPDKWAERKAAEIASFRRWLTGAVDDELKDVPALIRDAIKKGYDAGGKTAAERLKNAQLLSPDPVPFESHARIREFAKEAVRTVASTKPGILRSSFDEFRRVVSLVTGDLLTGTDTSGQAVRSAVRAWANKGITGFTDSAGRTWDLASYADMATRTSVMKATNIGKAELFGAAGEDLVIVSSHWETCDLCEEWEGVVLSLDGMTSGYPTLADAEAGGLFHPNCAHDYELYTPGLTSSIEPMTKDRDESKLVYRERMQQRRLERGIRQWTRRTLVATDDDEKRRCESKTAEWSGAMTKHIRDTNRRRKTSGVKAPPMRRQPGREEVIS
jgi:hypothetical protein